jgi:hypothetical protein
VLKFALGSSDVGGAPISHVVLGPQATGPVLKAAETKKPRWGPSVCLSVCLAGSDSDSDSDSVSDSVSVSVSVSVSH